MVGKEILGLWKEYDAGMTLEQLHEETDVNFPAFERLSNRLFEAIAMRVERRLGDGS